jgi:hypothetical protein
MVIQDIKLMKEKHAPALQAILKAMRVRWYDSERIAQYGRCRATLDPTERRDWACIRAMVINFGVKNQVVALRNRSKGTKRTLYSAHRSDKPRRKLECHD